MLIIKPRKISISITEDKKDSWDSDTTKTFVDEQLEKVGKLERNDSLQGKDWEK